MKLKIAIYAFLLSTFCGCSFKPSTVELSPPASVYMGERAYAKAFLSSVSDARANPSVIAFIDESDGRKTIGANQNVAGWIKAALDKEMRAAGFTFVTKEENADYSYSFTITKLHAEYSKKELTGKNLRLYADVTAQIKKGATTTVKNYKYEEQKWIKPIFDADGIKKELEPFLQESVANTVKSLAQLTK